MKIKNLKIKKFMYELEDDIWCGFMTCQTKAKKLLGFDLIKEDGNENLIPSSNLIKLEVDDVTLGFREYINLDSDNSHKKWIVYDENGEAFHSKEEAAQAIKELIKLGHTAVMTKGTYVYNNDGRRVSVVYDEEARGVSVQAVCTRGGKLKTKIETEKPKVYGKK